MGNRPYGEQRARGGKRSKATTLVCPPVASQIGAAAALDVGRSYCRPYVAELAEVRTIVTSKLAALAPLASVPTADGPFYALLKANTDLPPIQIAELLIPQYKLT